MIHLSHKGLKLKSQLHLWQSRKNIYKYKLLIEVLVIVINAIINRCHKCWENAALPL